MTPLSLGNIILLKEKGGMRESVPRQVDKKSRVPEEEKGAWGCQGGDKGLEFLRRRKRPKFPSTFLIKDCITTMYPAGDTFLLPENLRTNLVILKCMLWEWV